MGNFRRIGIYGISSINSLPVAKNAIVMLIHPLLSTIDNQFFDNLLLHYLSFANK